MEKEKIKITIVDDEKLIREGLKIILESYNDIEVLDLCQDGEEAFISYEKYKPEVILMDIRMPKCDGVLATKKIKTKYKDAKILILTTFADTEYIKEALKYGACGYLLKDSDYDLIHDGIIASFKGNVVISKDIASLMVTELKECVDEKEIMSSYNLNDREMTIIKKIADGLSNKEISEELFLSEGTIKNIITVILNKLNLRDRNQLTSFAFKNKLVK